MSDKVATNLKDIMATKGVKEILIILTDDERHGVVYLNQRYMTPMILDKISLNIERGTN